jgi:hypothetical protein
LYFLTFEYNQREQHTFFFFVDEDDMMIKTKGIFKIYNYQGELFSSFTKKHTKKY